MSEFLTLGYLPIIITAVFCLGAPISVFIMLGGQGMSKRVMAVLVKNPVWWAIMPPARKRVIKIFMVAMYVLSQVPFVNFVLLPVVLIVFMANVASDLFSYCLTDIWKTLKKIWTS